MYKYLTSEVTKEHNIKRRGEVLTPKRHRKYD